MSRITPVEEPAQPEIQVVFDQLKMSMGVPAVPNIFRVLAANPAVLETFYAAFKNVMLAGTLPQTVKEMICVRVSKCNGSAYCLDAHTQALSHLGVDRALLDAIISDPDQADLPPLTAEMLRFADKAAREPNGVTDEDFQRLREHGLADEEILEVLAIICANMMFNTLSSTVKVPRDVTS